MDDKYFVAWRCYQAIDSKSLRLLRFGALSRKQNCWISTTCGVLERQKCSVYTISSLSWAGHYWWRASRVRVEHRPGAHRAEATLGRPNTWWRKTTFSQKVSRIEISFMSMYNNSDWEQWQNSSSVVAYARRFPKKTLIIPWSWIRRKNGMSRSPTNQTGLGTESLNQWCSYFEKADILHSEERVLHSVELKKKQAEGHRHIVTRKRRLWSHYDTSLNPSIRSVCTEQWRTGAKILLSESQFILLSAREMPLQMGIMTQNLKSHQQTYELYQITKVLFCWSPKKLGAAQREIREPSRRPSIGQSLRWRWLWKRRLSKTLLCCNSRHSVRRIGLY